jgi:hypothetical protein
MRISFGAPSTRDDCDHAAVAIDPTDSSRRFIQVSGARARIFAPTQS